LPDGATCAALVLVTNTFGAAVKVMGKVTVTVCVAPPPLTPVAVPSRMRYVFVPSPMLIPFDRTVIGSTGAVGLASHSRLEPSVPRIRFALPVGSGTCRIVVHCNAVPLFVRKRPDTSEGITAPPVAGSRRSNVSTVTPSESRSTTL